MKVVSAALNTTSIKERLYKIILGPHISEKNSLLGDENNQYAFKVVPDATKSEVKKSIEELFQVVVTDVAILNVKGKVKRTARGFSRKKSWKKAYVSVQQGQEIDYLVGD
jgi:large subunit ribosomal protein L23